MSIEYRTLTYQANPPTAEGNGDMWIKQVGSSYNAYIYLNDWILLASGGVVITESNVYTHKYRVFIQESEPTLTNFKLKPGDIWIKESILQAYIYLWEWRFLIGA
jgi:hypothetical protein